MTVSYSQLSSLSCPAKYYYQYVEEVQATGHNALMYAGSALHAAIDKWWRTEEEEESIQALQEWFPSPGDDEKFTYGHCLEVLMGYMRTQYERAFHYDCVATEVMLEGDIAGVHVRGIVDRIMKHKPTERYEVWDTKCTSSRLRTKGMWMPPLESKWELSHQIPIYAYLARQELDLPIQVGKVEAVYMGFAKEFQPGEVRMVPIFDAFNPGDEAEVEGWISDRTLESKWRRANGIWPQLDGTLERQHICHRCDFKGLCGAPPDARPGLVELRYKPREKR